MAKRLPFLVNPPKSRRGKGKRRSSAATKRRSASGRRKRPVPAGFKSWREYMASIRPNKSGARSNPGGSKTMARKRKSGTKRRRSTARRNPAPAARANPPRRRRRARRNPRGFANVVPFVTGAARDAAIVVGGKIAARKVRGMIGQRPGTLLGSLVEGAVGIAGGMLLGSVAGADIGHQFAVGALSAPIETLIQQAGIPHVSDSLGDDGFLIGEGTGLGAYVNGDRLGDGYDESAQTMLGEGEAEGTTLGRYVAGQASAVA